MIYMSQALRHVGATIGNQEEFRNEKTRFGFDCCIAFTW